MFVAVSSIGKEVTRPAWKPSLASMSRELVMLVTCKLIFCNARLLLTLKVSTSSRLLMPIRLLRPVFVMRILSAEVRPVLPKLKVCSPGRAVKLSCLTSVKAGMDSSESTVKSPSSKPPIDSSAPKVKLDRSRALMTVKLPVMTLTVVISSC